MMTYIQTEPLTREPFAPFGDVIEYRGESLGNNQGRCRKYPALGVIQAGGASAVNAHLFLQAEAIQLPCRLQVLERHPIGSQMFMPVNKEPYLIVVASGDSQPDLSTLRCFIASHGQGIVYHPGVWHHPLLAMSDKSEFLVADPADVGKNLEEVFMSEQNIFVRK
ncbi:ureidoglycolate lyase [Endozoicomonas lisbonensis]|uniref:Ureidoglycolate lyase n=1 Tax=Endozoicomonas lisbonensis TaxID=3120522 RepID=A0ABV2SDC2_9GAMM